MEDRNIVEYALSLWIACLMHNPSILHEFYSHSDAFGTAEDFIL